MPLPPNFQTMVNDVLSRADVQPGYPDANGNTNTTWCNRAVDAIASQAGYSLGPILDPNPTTNSPDIGWTSANDLAQNAQQLSQQPGSGIQEVTAEQAQAIANAGGLAIALAANPDGHGHGGVVMPDAGPFDANAGPSIAQAGVTNGIMSANQAFGALQPSYYALPEPGQAASMPAEEGPACADPAQVASYLDGETQDAYDSDGDGVADASWDTDSEGTAYDSDGDGAADSSAPTGDSNE